MTPELAVLIEIRDLLAQSLAAQRPARCSFADRETLRRLLPGILGGLGFEPFSVKEVLADPALAAVAAMNGNRLGALLARAASDEADVNGLRVQRVATEHNTALWRVVSKPPDPL